ncbi:hypothetical protein Taro_041841 [Colocasia esculenta]|uniref:Uncharacterized protein n=1 Tax=Colocasia esculenta TaxID=4460 RepID=A0A843WX00_COLES|nr:hypothetical protein [Colocasia esculenta]
MSSKFRNCEKVLSKKETIQGSCRLRGSVERDPRHFSEAACSEKSTNGRNVRACQSMAKTPENVNK